VDGGMTLRAIQLVVGSRQQEVRGRRSEVRGQTTEDRRQMADDRWHEAEVRGRRSASQMVNLSNRQMVMNSLGYESTI
jgi:hypothetical protein